MAIIKPGTTYMFADPEAGSSSAAEMMSEDGGQTWLNTGRRFNTESDYYKRTNPGGVSYAQSEPTNTINYDYGKLGTDSEKEREISYKSTYFGDDAAKTKSETVQSGIQDVIETYAKQGINDERMTDALGRYDEYSQSHGAGTGAPTGYVDDLTGKWISTERTGEEKLAAYNGSAYDYSGREKTSDDFFDQFGYQETERPDTSQMTGDEAKIAMANWERDNALAKSESAANWATQTAADAQRDSAQIKNAQAKSELAAGISAMEDGIKSNQNSASNTAYNKQKAAAEEYKAEAYAQIDDDLSGLSPSQKAVYEKSRKQRIDKIYEDMLDEYKEQYEESVKSEARGKYANLEASVSQFAKIEASADPDKAAKSAWIDDRAREIQAEWAVSHPNAEPMEAWQAKEAATDEANTPLADLEAVQDLTLMRQTDAFSGSASGTEFSTAVRLFDGDISKAKKYWNKYLPAEEVKKQEEDLYTKMGYDQETKDEELKRSELLSLMDVYYDNTNDATEQQKAAAYKQLQKELINDPYNYGVVNGIRIYKRNNNGELPSANEMIQMQQDLQRKVDGDDDISDYANSLWDRYGDEIMKNPGVIETGILVDDPTATPEMAVSSPDFFVKASDGSVKRRVTFGAYKDELDKIMQGEQAKGNIRPRTGATFVDGVQVGKNPSGDFSVEDIGGGIDISTLPASISGRYKNMKVDNTYKELIEKYFPAEEVGNAIMVMQGESQQNPSARGDTTLMAGEGDAQIGDSVGLFQIRTGEAREGKSAYNRAAEKGMTADEYRNWLMVPENNIKTAAEMFERRTDKWGDWTVARELGIYSPSKESNTEKGYNTPQTTQNTLEDNLESNRDYSNITEKDIDEMTEKEFNAYEAAQSS